MIISEEVDRMKIETEHEKAEVQVRINSEFFCQT